MAQEIEGSNPFAHPSYLNPYRSDSWWQVDDGSFAVIAWDAVEGHPTPETAWWLQ